MRKIDKNSSSWILVICFLLVAPFVQAQSTINKPQVFLYHVLGSKSIIPTSPLWTYNNGFIVTMNNGTFWKGTLLENGASGVIFGEDRTNGNYPIDKFFIPNGTLYNNVECKNGCEAVIAGITYNDTNKRATFSMLKCTRKKKLAHGGAIFMDLKPINTEINIDLLRVDTVIKSAHNESLTIHYANNQWKVNAACACISDKTHKTRYDFQGSFVQYANNQPFFVANNDQCTFDQLPAHAILFYNTMIKKWELFAENGQRGIVFIEK
ncbi:MAG: hypothetical protein QM528_02670 [Phycisphaerales bacterium]|nr:hypothetical protein [Phycisphaerales bacterium]